MLDGFELPDPPDATLIAGPVGGGKTEAAIAAILSAQDFRPWGTVWVLLATGQQENAFRNRLLARSRDATFFGVEFFSFHQLYSRLLDLAGDPQRQISETARHQILRHVAEDLRARGELEYFAAIAHLPGFIGLLAGFINELKQGLVTSDSFTRAAGQRTAKDRDLARIYAAYQDFLQRRRLVDRHGAGWLAVQHLEQTPQLARQVDLLVVDGFDQFNRVHVRLLAALAHQVKRAVLTLPHVPGEQGQRFRRFARTFTGVLNADRALWQVQALDPAAIPAEAARPPVLDHLMGAIFQGQPERVVDDGTITLIEAPDTDREVQMVLRHVKRRLLAGVAPDAVAVVARRMADYGGALRATARAYGVPLVVREGLRLRDNPAVALLLALIDLSAQDFPRRELLDILHSPYVTPPDLTPGQIAQVERISLAHQVVRGRSAWLDAIEASALGGRDEDGDDLPALDPAEAGALYRAVQRHLARLSPPPTGTAYAFTQWIADLIGPDPDAAAHDVAEGAEIDPHSGGSVQRNVSAPAAHVNLLGGVRAAADAERVARDVSALHEFRNILAGIRAAHDLVSGDGAPPVTTWVDFRAELELAVERAEVVPVGGSSRLGRVLATDVLEVRGLPHDHIFILGLSEGVFPQPEPEDPLYTPQERADLERTGIEVQTAAERADDLSLFYQTAGLARRSLTLSRFTVDRKGTPCQPSPYWNAVRALVEIPGGRIERAALGAAPRLDDAATLHEAALALAAVFSGEQPEGEIAAESVYNALLDHADGGARWRNVLRGRAVEARREDPAHPFDRFSGLLAEPSLIAEAARALGPERVWSASQLNDLGVCSFRFFARRLLRLEELKEPEEGLDALQRGQLNHAILEGTYRRIFEEELTITPDNQANALAILEDAAADVFADAPTQFGFRPSPLWRHESAEMLRRLRALVITDFSAASPFRPVTAREARPVAVQVQGLERRPLLLEVAYGFEGDCVVDGPAGPVRVRGVIDRMDAAGGWVIVVDYKTGATPHPVEDMRLGRDYQMMLYLLAAQALLPPSDPPLYVAGGLFWHIGSRAVSGEVRADDPALEEARAQLHAQVQAARAGQFAVLPRKVERGQCVAYCEFKALCRLSRAHPHKPFGES